MNNSLFGKRVILDAGRDPDEIVITVDDSPKSVPRGITLTAALIRQGCWWLRDNTVTSERRGPYCGMGVCFECEVSVGDRLSVRACMIRVYEGMVVRTGRSRT